MWALGGTIAIATFALAALIALIDPYRLTGWGDMMGRTTMRPRPSSYQYQVKMANFLASRNDSVILGNSRADIGFDPEHPAWAARSFSAYNLALPGTGLDTTQEQVFFLLSKGRALKMSVLGVDFLDFLVRPDPPPDAGRPYDLPEKDAMSSWRWRQNTAFSMNALEDAVSTLLLAKKKDPEVMTDKGANPLFEYRAAARREGYHAIFRQRAQENAYSYSTRPRSIVHADGSMSRSMATLERIVDVLAAKRTEVVLVIYPYHAQILAMWDEFGLTPQFVQWKRVMTDLVARAQVRHPDATIRLWDFSGYNDYTCERIPSKGDLKSTTRWYWEAGHFKKELGDVMLEKILSGPASASMESISTFGSLLEPHTLAMLMPAMEIGRVNCLRSNPGLFAEVKQLVEGVRKQ